MTEELLDAEQRFTFSEYEGLAGEPDSLRPSPNSGTNMSTVFSEASLGVLGMNEEQLEVLAALRSVPQPLLSNYQHLDSAVEILQHVKADLRRRSELLERTIDKLNAQCIRPLAPSQAKTLLNLSIAERKAGKNLTLFSAHCRGVRSRFLGMSLEDKVGLEVFFDQMEMLLRRLQYKNAYSTASDLFYGETVDSTEVIGLGMVYSLLDADVERFEAEDIALARSTCEHIRDFYTRSQPLEGGLAIGQTQWLCTQLSVPNDPDRLWKRAQQDLDIFRFLFGIDTTRELDETAMTELIYGYLKDRLVQHLCTTPAEFALSALLTEHISTFSSCLLLGSLLNSYMWRFNNSKSGSAATLCYRISESFRMLSRVGHLLGIQPPESFQLLAQHCEHIMPYLSASESPQTTSSRERVEEAARIAHENDSLRCWSYRDARRPWLPARQRRSLNTVSPFGIIRSDVILSSLRSSDMWMSLKWAGVDIDALSDESILQIRHAISTSDFGIGSALDSTVDNQLLQCLFQFAKQEPERNASFIVSLLGLSTREKPLFFNKDEELTFDEVPAAEVQGTLSAEQNESDSDEWPDL
jgi:hypothetical protein